MSEIILINNKGEIVLEIDSEEFPIIMPLKTWKWGEREYTLKLCYQRDPDTRQTDKTKITGAVLQ